MKKNRLNLVLTLLLTLTMLAMTGCGGATAAAPADNELSEEGRWARDWFRQ